MAKGALHATGANHALATTGIAGPDGGTDEKPVGTVYVALAIKEGFARVERHRFPTDRETFKFLASQAALDLLRRTLS
jgi:nicotinamide-nucleotide amidase